MASYLEYTLTGATTPLLPFGLFTGTYSGDFVVKYNASNIATSVQSSDITLSVGGFPLETFSHFHLVYAEGTSGHAYNEITDTETIAGIGSVTLTLDFTNEGHSLLASSKLSASIFGISLGTSHFNHGGTVSTDPVCFMAGTLVSTPRGPVAIETLRAGEMVLTREGRAAPIRWLGIQTIHTTFADPVRALPIRIRAEALAANLPERDLLVSPCHALLIDGVLVQAGALVNGLTITRETDVPEVFTYYHVELEDHALILAEGVPAETFVDHVDRFAFDNWAERAESDLDAPIAEMDFPRAQSPRQLPRATRLRLEQRADAMLGYTARLAA